MNWSSKSVDGAEEEDSASPGEEGARIYGGDQGHDRVAASA
ncbi:MAG: hypothetical protein Q8P67_27425 [archaeon]|nr:hypothetical protein [archaeon]